MSVKTCEYCGRVVDSRGYLSHVHFKHRAEVIQRFRTNPMVQFWLAYFGDGPKLLPEKAS